MKSLSNEKKKISEPPVYEKGSNETTLDPPPKWSVNAFKQNYLADLYEKGQFPG
jgi:hypothetical protein